MAKDHHKSFGKRTAGRRAQADPQRLLREIETFIAACRRPTAIDWGESPLELRRGSFSLSLSAGKLNLEVWDESRTLSRRIGAIDRLEPGLMECSVVRFGGATGSLQLLDLDRPRNDRRAGQAEQRRFAEQFRQTLLRQFPGWSTSSLSVGLDLSHSFSSAFPRAHLRRGSRQIAAAACPDAQREPDFLTGALLWFDHWRIRLKPGESLALCLFLPQGSGALTAGRLKWLTGHPLCTRIFLFNEHGAAGEVDPTDLGNIRSSVSSLQAHPLLSPELSALLCNLGALQGFSCSPAMDGTLSLRMRGLEFASIKASNQIGLGIRERKPITDLQELETFAKELADLSGRPETQVETYSERWFEDVVRNNLATIDCRLRPDPVHGQVLAFAGLQRELVDLLAVTSAGRLAVLELKTAEDLHLPIQALDYWIGIGQHARRGEIGHLFPAIALRPLPPLLYLVAPALSFHSSSETILQYFSPAIEVHRVGIGSHWSSMLEVVFRLQGAQVPVSHQEFNELRCADQHQEGD